MNRRKSIFDHLPQTEKINDSDSESSKSEDEDLDSSQSSKRSGKSSLIEATSKKIQIKIIEEDDSEDEENEENGSNQIEPKPILKHPSKKLSFDKHSLMNDNVEEKDEDQLSDNEEYVADKLNNKKIVFNINPIISSSNKENNVDKHNFNNYLKVPDEHYSLPNKTDKEILINGKGDTTKNPKKSSIKKNQKYKPIKLESNHSPKETFVELVQLTETGETDENDDKVYEWRELSRWIKYEQNADMETGLWSKPFVGPLFYQSLLYLRTGLQYGTILLDSVADKFEQIIDEMLQDFVDAGHLEKDNRDELEFILTSQFVHHQSNHHQSIIHSSNALSGVRRKSIMPDFLQSNSRRPSHHSSNSNNALNQNKSQVSISIHDNDKFHRHDSGVKFHISDSEQASTPKMARRGTIANIKAIMHIKSNKSETSIKNMQDEIEGCILMIGTVEFLDKPGNYFYKIVLLAYKFKFINKVMAFVRLNSAHMFEDLIQNQDQKIKTRFLFVLLGPKTHNIDYLEIGRCMGALMANKDFHLCAYKSVDRKELIESIVKFTGKSLCLVLPSVDNDDAEDVLNPIVDWIKNNLKKKKKKADAAKRKDKSRHKKKKPNALEETSSLTGSNEVVGANHSSDNGRGHNDPFKRTGCLFGGLLSEMKNRYSHYIDDITDGLNMRCFVSFIFIFTVCFSPALTFGGILSDKTDQWFGLNEMLLATSINGVIFGLFSGQPMLILGPTGPFLIFEEMLYLFCKNKFCIEFLATRVWISIWILLFAILMVAFEGIFIIHNVTRFTEDIFSFLVAIVFLTDCFKRIFKIFKHDPLYKLEKYCNFYVNSSTNYLNSFVNNNNNYTERKVTFSNSTLNATKIRFCDVKDDDYQNYLDVPQPNIALLSLGLCVATCVIALAFKQLRFTNFFSTHVRRILSDIGILIAMLSVVSVDFLIENKTGIRTKKTDIPSSFAPTKTVYREEWFISPLGNKGFASLPLWVPFASAIPAFLIFIVLFMEVELTGVMLLTENKKMKKGNGFNIDLLIAAMLMTLNSFFGLPWMCAAPVNTLAHWASLTEFSKTKVPGEKPKLIKVTEQRVTSISVHVAIGLCLMASSILNKIPLGVLLGIFLYFGIVSLFGTQFFERIQLMFKPSKYRSNAIYSRAVRPVKRNLFTIIQIIALVVLMLFKSYVQISFLFPIILVLLVPLRKFILPKFFTHKELEQLDHHAEDEEIDNINDFQNHLPI